jgi:hypothetical protein
MGFISRLATDRIADRLAFATARAIAEVVDRRTDAVRETVARLRAEHPDDPPRELARQLTRTRERQLGASGGVSALPSVLPGFGTAAGVGTALADLSLVTVAQAELVLAIAHIYSRPLEDRAARRLDVLLVLGMQADAVKLHRDGSVEVLGARHRAEELSGVEADKLAARVNRKLAAEVVSRLARRRAGILLGRAVPVVGVGLAAWFDLWSTHSVGGKAVAYFEHLV